MSMPFRCIALLFCHLVTAPFAQGQTCICSGFNSARSSPDVSFPNGSAFARARANLTDPDFFGPSGLVNRPIVIASGTGSATPPTLSGVEVFFTGHVPTTSYTLSERTEILNAVRNGLNLVVTTDDPDHDISDLFGVALNSAGAEMNTVTLADHPIFAGPFGRVTQFRGDSPAGNFRSWPAGTLLLASSSAGASMLLIPKGILGSGAGAVLLISDVDILTTTGRDLNPNTTEPSLPVTDALMMNIVAFLCNPGAPLTAPHLIFPQISDGSGIVSTLVLTSAGAGTITSINVSFRDDNGAPFNVSLTGIGSASSFVIGSLETNRTLTFTTPGTGLLRSGTALIRGSPLLTGNVLFMVPNLGIAGVSASEISGGFNLPVVPSPAGDVSTGVAVSNLTNKTASLRLELWDSSGRRSDGILNATIPPNGHFARFLFELYPGLDFAGFRGTLRIVSRNTLLAVTALQLGNSAGQFTALPVKALFR